MWIRSSGQLTESVYQLTTPVSSHFLIFGDVVALVDTSISACAPRLIEELDSYLGEDVALDLVFLTHASFDTIGGLPFLRAKYPDLEVMAAPLTAERLREDSRRVGWFEKNQAYANAMNASAELQLGDAALNQEVFDAALEVNRIVGDGDSVDLGEDVEVKLIATPGYAADAVAYFVQAESALAASESVGSYAGRDKVTNCFADDYQDYLESLGKLSGLDVKALGFPHSGAITGEMVQRYFMDAKAEAEQFRSLVKEKIDQGEILDEIAASILPDWLSEQRSPCGPFAEEREQVLLSMVKAAAESESAITE